MPDSVTQWLEQLGLGEYAEAFDENAVDWKTLPELDHALLKEVGVKAVGHRVAILKAIESLNAEPETADKAASVASPPTLAAEAEHRQLTVMFCDLVGSTELSQQLDPEDLREVNRAYQDACKSAIERYDGYVARYMGDGVLAYFGYPQAHEDDAERAIHAGLGVAKSVAELDGSVGDRRGVELGVRVGIATGPVVVGDLIGEGASQESAVVGETPNLAARLQALAATNAVVVSPGTYVLAAGQFEYENLGDHELKGITESVQAWRVIAPVAAESRFEAAHRAGLTPLVGREHEIGLLLERWEQAKEGDGQVILLSGEAGIGKSRITETLRERTITDNPVRLRYQCSPYHTNSALYPFIQQLGHAAQFDVEDTNENKLDKLESLLAQGARDTEAVVPLIAPVLSIPLAARYRPVEMAPERQKEATLEALCAQMEGLSRLHPVLLIFEDVHWADPTSLELLEHVIDRAQDLPILAVITSRPEFTPPWTGYTHATALTLNRFTRRLAAAMVEKVTAGKPLPDEVLEQIIEKTDGVPLFVEELTKTILESGPLTEVAIPTTLHDSLMARLDRLGAVKEVAQTASAIGREFDYDLLAVVSPLSIAELHGALSQLIDAGLVFRRSRSQEGAYIFKHALVQDAAYESLLRGTRRDLHQRIAEAFQSRFPETVEAQPELLGHHYTEAGLAEKAIVFWQQAGQRAVERSANAEAIAYLYKALGLLKALPDTRERQQRELTLHTMVAGPLIATKGYGAEETGRAFSRAQELSAQVGASAEFFPVMYGRWVYNVSWQKYRECIQIAKQFSDFSREQTDAGPILMAHRITGITQFLVGQPDECRENLRKTIELYEPEEHASLKFRFGQDPLASALAFSSLCLWQLGYADQAETACRDSVEQARKLDHINTLAYVECLGAAVLHQLSANLEALKQVVASVESLAQEHSLAMWMAFISITDSWIIARHHHDRHGLAQMQKGLDELNKTFQALLPHRLAMLADAHMAFGEADTGLAVVDAAVELADKVGERWFEPELHRLKAELLLSSARPATEAEVNLLESLRLARAQRAKSFELRSATCLARLWADRGKRHEAIELLLPVYNWFTEGFDTPDLKEAKALLDQLA